jgi:hypothetical protein
MCSEFDKVCSHARRALAKTKLRCSCGTCSFITVPYNGPSLCSGKRVLSLEFESSQLEPDEHDNEDTLVSIYFPVHMSFFQFFGGSRVHVTAISSLSDAAHLSMTVCVALKGTSDYPVHSSWLSASQALGLT